MSIKRRINYKMGRLAYKFNNISFPSWLDSLAVKGILVCFVAMIGAGYVVTTSSSTSYGYEVHKLEKQIDKLVQEERKIQIQVAELNSLKNIEQKLSSINMVPVDNVRHVKSGDNMMAQR